MRVDPDKLLFGVAPRILIDCAKQLHGELEFDLPAFCEALGAPEWEAASVIEGLVRDGFVTFDAERSVYVRSDKFNQLALASIGKGITRAEADRLLAAVVAQARAINGDPHAHRCSVKCIVVFGSFLTDAERLGDLDIGVDIAENRRATRAEFDAMMAGRRTSVDKAMSLLRLRKPKVISVHMLREVLELDTPYRIVFGMLAALPQRGYGPER